MRHLSKKAITVYFHGRTLVGDILSQNSTTDLLMLHGGGNANRHRFKPLRKRLFSKGISSCAFDFSGYTGLFRLARIKLSRISTLSASNGSIGLYIKLQHCSKVQTAPKVYHKPIRVCSPNF
jgi:hypothetical protein